MRARLLFAVAAIGAHVSGCSLLIDNDAADLGGGGEGIDAGRDAGDPVEDAGRPDGGRPGEDAGPIEDGGPPTDARERNDAGHDADAGRPDAGRPDAGRPDAGRPDAGRPDAGRPDAGRPDAGPPICPDDCDDDVACTADRCRGGVCEHTPQDTACGDRQRCHPTLGCVPILCTSDAECDDGRFCNGRERCAPTSPGAGATGCLSGPPPVCGDGVACTEDRCDADLNRCVFVADDGRCDDGVDCTTDRCAPGTGCVTAPDSSACDRGFCFVGEACDPTSGCTPGAPRDCRDLDPCTIDGCDADAETCTHTLRDDDGDGFGAASFGGRDCGGGDCDDADPAVNPDADEHCNGVDDDCDGETDEGCPVEPADTCAAPQVLVLDSSGRATVRGTLGDYASDYDTICDDDVPGPDAVYSLQVDSLSDVTITTLGSAADTVVAVDTRCAPGRFRFTCDDDIDATTTDSRVWVHRLEPRNPDGSARTLYILLQGAGAGDTGDFVLDVRVTRARDDDCTGPIDVTGGGSMLGFLRPSPLGGGHRGSCQLPAEDGESEGVATFRAADSGAANLFVITTSYRPDFYVRDGPCATGVELACERGRAIPGGFLADLDLTVASTSRYFVFTDGALPVATGEVAYWLSYTP